MDTYDFGSDDQAMHLDRAMATLAASQWGVATREQLVDLGLKDDAIDGRLERGNLHAVAPAVFAVGHPAISRRGRGIAALLHVGPGGALSYESAARIWGMKSPAFDGPVHVSVKGRSDLVEPEGMKIHRPRSLTAADVTSHRGLRVTTPERTILDLMPKATEVEVTRMLEQMVTKLDYSPDWLHTWGHAVKRRPGRATLWRALDGVAGPAVIRSEFESLFRSLCQDAGLPPARTNHRIGRWEVDAVWVEQRVAVELDSWRYHGGRWQFHQDRKKGLAISRAGFELIRLTWPQVKYDQAEVAEAISHALKRSEWRLGSSSA